VREKNLFISRATGISFPGKCVAKKLLCHLHLLKPVNEATTATTDPDRSREIQVLVLEPDEKVAMEILAALEEAMPGRRTRVARSLGEAQQLVVDQKPALFVLDVDATYDMGQEFIYDLRTSHPNARAIILTAIHFAAREQIRGLGAIHFLEKPFPRADFITLVEALLASHGEASDVSFHGALSDLHVSDIIQLKCMSGATSILEFTGPRGEKARVYFENGQVRHATAPGRDGLEAFNEIVNWQGGKISEVPVTGTLPHTIHADWQLLLMEAVRKMDEDRAVAAETASAATSGRPHGRRALVVDDSVMLLSFVKEILEENGWEVATAETGEEGLRLAAENVPDLILLDFVLPDMKGDEVCRQLLSDPERAKVPVVYVSGFGAELQAGAQELPNVVGLLNKPFTSEHLLAAVRKYADETPLPAEGQPDVPAREIAPASPPLRRPPPLARPPAESLGASNGPKPQPAIEPAPPPPPQPAPINIPAEPRPAQAAAVPDPTGRADVLNQPMEEEPAKAAEAYFCGDSSFFSLHWALQTIAREKLTGALRAFWSRDSVDLLAREGKVVLVTTRNATLYCEEAPVTLLNVPGERIQAARERQAEDGCPLFLTLASEGLILREPGLQLVQHYGQKLFSQLWTDRVRFTFEQRALPDYAAEISAAEDTIDQWALSTLRFVQYQELGDKATAMDASSIPAYTRDGFQRVQELRLTVAEAQFASQFNGSRSVGQISKNLRLDIKFARLTLFRFLALEIVECWPAQISEKPEGRSGFRGLFGR
jgi:CheY-like chemotaxis protein